MGLPGFNHPRICHRLTVPNFPSVSEHIIATLAQVPDHHVYGRVTEILGMLVQVGGIERDVSLGGRCHLVNRNRVEIPCEVVGFRNNQALLMPFGALEGIGLGTRAEVIEVPPMVFPTQAWLGRVVNALGQPVDGKGPLPQGTLGVPIRNTAPSAHTRQRLGDKLDLGVRAMNAFLAVCRGQRMGIFSGSGVGKSVLLSMLARYTATPVSVIGLVGERGREVQEFIEDDLGPEGLARSVVVVATSDESPLMRRQAAYMTMSIAEYFRDLGEDVLCMIDSITRFAMSQREIGLSAGEPPTSKGYPPTTFSELAKLLERSGPGAPGQGMITGLFTVLVDGDDHNEPIADAVRGILDGHIVLERQIAERGRYPAINILKSVSRSMPACNTRGENELIMHAKKIISLYEDMAELIRLGAYRKGSDPEVDKAIATYPAIETFLRQQKGECTRLRQGFEMLAEAIGVDPPPADQPLMGRQ